MQTIAADREHRCTDRREMAKCRFGTVPPPSEASPGSLRLRECGSFIQQRRSRFRRAKAAIGKRVTVFDYPDGRLSIRYKGVELAYRTFDKIRQVDQGAIADNKLLGPVLAMIRDEQRPRGPERRSWARRHDQRDARLFKVG
jgi:hypothetical protein